MKQSVPEMFSGVSVATKANIYFEGKVVSHSVERSDGSRCTLGLIYPGSWHFGTNQAERMEIVDGRCSVVLDGADESRVYATGDSFEVPAKSGFTITVEAGICQYVCSFLD